MRPSKKALRHFYSRLRLVNPKALLAILFIFGFLSAIALRSNNIEMLRLRDAVFVADERGEGVGEALDELRLYVFNHMNTDLSSGGVSIRPPIQLKHTYDRLTSVEKSRVAEINKDVTSRATRQCEAQFPAGQIRQRAACVDKYIADNTVQENAVPKELYQFDFASPWWSPDFAGFSILATIFVAALLIVRLILGVIIKHELK